MGSSGSPERTTVRVGLVKRSQVSVSVVVGLIAMSSVAACAESDTASPGSAAPTAAETSDVTDTSSAIAAVVEITDRLALELGRFVSLSGECPIDFRKVVEAAPSGSDLQPIDAFQTAYLRKDDGATVEYSCDAGPDGALFGVHWGLDPEGDLVGFLQRTGSDDFELIGDPVNLMGGTMFDARSQVSAERINGETFWTDGKIWISVWANHLDVDATNPWLQAILPQALAALNALDPATAAQPVEV